MLRSRVIQRWFRKSERLQDKRHFIERPFLILGRRLIRIKAIVMKKYASVCE